MKIFLNDFQFRKLYSGLEIRFTFANNIFGGISGKIRHMMISASARYPTSKFLFQKHSAFGKKSQIRPNPSYNPAAVQFPSSQKYSQHSPFYTLKLFNSRDQLNFTVFLKRKETKAQVFRWKFVLEKNRKKT